MAQELPDSAMVRWLSQALIKGARQKCLVGAGDSVVAHVRVLEASGLPAIGDCIRCASAI